LVARWVSREVEYQLERVLEGALLIYRQVPDSLAERASVNHLAEDRRRLSATDAALVGDLLERLDSPRGRASARADVALMPAKDYPRFCAMPGGRSTRTKRTGGL
jgi:hypothetical protein